MTARIPALVEEAWMQISQVYEMGTCPSWEMFEHTLDSFISLCVRMQCGRAFVVRSSKWRA